MSDNKNKDNQPQGSSPLKKKRLVKWACLEPSRRSRRERKAINKLEVDPDEKEGTRAITDKDKRVILNTLLRCDTLDIDALCAALPSKSRYDITAYIAYQESLARKHRPEVQEKTAQEAAPMQKWLKLLTTNSPYVACDHSYLLGDVLAVCSALEPHFTSSASRIPKYDSLYNYLRALLRCEPLPKLLATESAMILDLMDQMIPELKSCDADKQMAFIKTKFVQLEKSIKDQKLQKSAAAAAANTESRKRVKLESENQTQSPGNKRRKLTGYNIQSTSTSSANSSSPSKSDIPQSSASRCSSNVGVQSNTNTDTSTRDSSNQPNASNVDGEAHSAEIVSNNTSSASTGEQSTSTPLITSRTSQSASSTAQSTSSTSQSTTKATNVQQSTSRTASPQISSQNIEKMIVQSLNPLGIPVSLLNISKKEGVVLLNGSVSMNTAPTKKRKRSKSSKNVNGTTAQKLSPTVGDTAPQVVQYHLSYVGNNKRSKRPLKSVNKQPQKRVNNGDLNNQALAEKTQDGDAAAEVSSKQIEKTSTDNIEEQQKEITGVIDEDNVITMMIGGVWKPSGKGFKNRRSKSNHSDSDKPRQVEMMLLDFKANVIFSALLLDSSNKERKEEVVKNIRDIIASMPNKTETKNVIRVHNETGNLLTPQECYFESIIKSAYMKRHECLIVESILQEYTEENKEPEEPLPPVKTPPKKGRFVNPKGRPFGYRTKHWNQVQREKTSPKNSSRRAKKTPPEAKTSGTPTRPQNTSIDETHRELLQKMNTNPRPKRATRSRRTTQEEDTSSSVTPPQQTSSPIGSIYFVQQKDEDRNQVVGDNEGLQMLAETALSQKDSETEEGVATSEIQFTNKGPSNFATIDLQTGDITYSADSPESEVPAAGAKEPNGFGPSRKQALASGNKENAAKFGSQKKRTEHSRTSENKLNDAQGVTKVIVIGDNTNRRVDGIIAHEVQTPSDAQVTKVIVIGDNANNKVTSPKKPMQAKTTGKKGAVASKPAVQSAEVVFDGIIEQEVQKESDAEITKVIVIEPTATARDTGEKAAEWSKPASAACENSDGIIAQGGQKKSTPVSKRSRAKRKSSESVTSESHSKNVVLPLMTNAKQKRRRSLVSAPKSDGNDINTVQSAPLDLSHDSRKKSRKST